MISGSTRVNYPTPPSRCRPIPRGAVWHLCSNRHSRSPLQFLRDEKVRSPPNGRADHRGSQIIDYALMALTLAGVLGIATTLLSLQSPKASAVRLAVHPSKMYLYKAADD